VAADGEQLGILPLRDALRLAAERGMDLVEVAPTAKPPVCRLMDYGKFRYEQAKRSREARKRQKVVTIKEVKLRPRIEGHDFEVKLRNALRFLEEGNKVKVTIMFRGREIVHSELGRDVLARLAKGLEHVGTIERAPRVEGRNMIMIMSPRPQPQTQSQPAQQQPPQPPPAAK
jgi:translation initiation factor IF-3